eukprot:CAMPEP_0198147034 /NCGR_PEP_ID=MMETSP1443-20131203/33003_1 /TAXON_ID=186043 /ORGANISM="Entomoneis sp., Strain CCMP2396" /LENGTH=364 /DNA_ID=CAMNT_0043811183 /DNA_START=13 /DNA_END=1104 /DNA_ORIENTATION=+
MRALPVFSSALLWIACFSVRCSHVEAKEGECKNDEGDGLVLLPNPTKTLHNGAEMPLFQLGSAQLTTDFAPDADAPPGFVGMQPERMYRQIELALSAGLRAFDTALIYGTQKGLGHVLGEWWRTGKLQARKDVWITTKIFHPRCNVCLESLHMPGLSDMTPEEVSVKTEEHFEKSLQELNVGYLDLVLIHWPGEDDKSAGRPLDPEMNRQRRIAAWKVLEKMYKRGWCRAIGVSNFDIPHLEQLKQDGATILPMVNQIESSVEVQHVEIREYCQKHGIVVQAYSALRGLGEGTRAKQLLQTLGTKYGKDVGQVAFRYLYQHGYAIVYLTNSKKRVKSNTEIFDFELTADEMEAIDGLNHSDGGW